MGANYPVPEAGKTEPKNPENWKCFSSSVHIPQRWSLQLSHKEVKVGLCFFNFHSDYFRHLSPGINNAQRTYVLRTQINVFRRLWHPLFIYVSVSENVQSLLIVALDFCYVRHLAALKHSWLVFSQMDHEDWIRMDYRDGYFPSGDFHFFDRPAVSGRNRRASTARGEFAHNFANANSPILHSLSVFQNI